MTAFEPPDFTYFSGLQFNPEIYENPLVEVASNLYGAVVAIVGTISTIITTPLFKVIQGALTTIEATEVYTEFKNSVYWKITAPNIYFSPLGTWSAFTCSSTLTQFYNPTKVAIDADGTILLDSPSTELRGPVVNFDSTYVPATNVNLNFYSSNANPLVRSSRIVASGGTATADNGQLDITADVVNIGGTTALITLTDVVKIVSGFCFTDGNLTATTGGFYIQTGFSTLQATLGASNAVSGTFTFTTAFRLNQPVYIALNVHQATAGVCRVVVNYSNPTNTGFTWNAYNPTAVTSGVYNVYYIAIGRNLT